VRLVHKVRQREDAMQTARYINIALWFYLLVSEALLPVTTDGDFWTEKAKQALRLNHNIFDNPAFFLGNAITILVLWFICDWLLRRLFGLDRGSGK
jgi:hypothetical protein